MDKKKEETVEERIKKQYDDLSEDFVAAVRTIYEEVTHYHERRVRLHSSMFRVVQEDLERVRRCLISLLLFDWTEGKQALIIQKMWLLPEEGGHSGWVYFVFRRPTPRGQNDDCRSSL